MPSTDPIIVPAVKEDSFRKSLAKTFVTSLASSAGVWGGLVVVGLAASAVNRRRDKKEAAEKSELPVND